MLDVWQGTRLAMSFSQVVPNQIFYYSTHTDTHTHAHNTAEQGKSTKKNSSSVLESCEVNRPVFPLFLFPLPSFSPYFSPLQVGQSPLVNEKD